MKVASKIVGICLVVTLIAALTPAMFMTDAWAAADRGGPVDGAVGCHAHRGSQHGDSRHPHLPAPLSYRCCMTGHDAAVVQASQSPQPLAQCAGVASHIEPGVTKSVVRGVEGLIVLSADPSSTSQLRI